MASTIFSQQVWETRLAQRLDKPQSWKEVLGVIYTDTQTTVLPYVGTTGEPAVQTSFMANAAARNTLSNVIAPGVITMATETLDIVSMEYDSVYLDYADQAQSNYAKIGQMADLLGKKIGERVEALTLGQHASWTNIGDNGSGGVGLSSTALTVTSSNIDDIVRGVKEQINTANGFNMMNDNGAFIVWRPQDWTLLEAFAQANGFNMADAVLKNGLDGRVGVYYMGVWHYVSTGHTAGHIFAGVRNMFKLGLLNSTYGKVYQVEHPASSTAGYLSGTNVYSRLDYGFKLQTNVAPIVFDVNVN